MGVLAGLEIATAGCGRTAPATGGEDKAQAAPSATPAAPGATGLAPAEALQLWRGAIRDRNPDTVMACDQMFTGAPSVYTPALSESAQKDSEERVRAFSTRVLGKFANPELGPLFLRLLEDPSPYVRGNAAWALGQLSPEVGQAALERLRAQDHDDAVKQSATEALARLRGPAPPAHGHGGR